MKENLKLGGILLTITLVAGLLLGFANSLTAEAIIENSKVSKEDLQIIMPEASSLVDIANAPLDEKVTEAYNAVNNNGVEVGYIFKITTKGFHGPVQIVVGISKEEKVTGIRILAHSETPGLGAKITEEKFLSKIKNLPTDEFVEVVKVEPSKENEIQGVSGASVSSKAVGSAINDAIKFYKEEIKGEEVAPQEDTDSNTSATY